MAFVYILRNESGNYYVGSTSDLNRRLRQHSYGHTQTTRNRDFNQLVFRQEFNSLMEARKVERKLKRLKRKDYLERVVKDGYIKLSPS